MTPRTSLSQASCPCALSLLLAAVLLPGLSAHAADPPAPLYANNFETADPGKLPEDILVLAGEFSIRKDSGNAFLELAPVPLDSHVVLLGPEEPSPSSVQARIFGTPTGKRFPEFGVGLAGNSGYKLWLMPATAQLQLRKNEDVVATVPHQWTGGTWTTLRLQLHKLPDGKAQLQGKAWTHGKPEPADWMITWTDPESPLTGRASLWAEPYSETPVRFDDVLVTR